MVHPPDVNDDSLTLVRSYRVRELVNVDELVGLDRHLGRVNEWFPDENVLVVVDHWQRCPMKRHCGQALRYRVLHSERIVESVVGIVGIVGVVGFVVGDEEGVVGFDQQHC